MDVVRVPSIEPTRAGEADIDLVLCFSFEYLMVRLDVADIEDESEGDRAIRVYLDCSGVLHGAKWTEVKGIK